MNTKSFITLLIAVVALGGGLGASFAGGMAVGKNQVEASAIPPTAQLVAPTNSEPTADDSADSVTDQLQELRDRIASGEQPSAEELQLLRDQFQGQTGGGFGGTGGGFGGGGFGGGGGGGGGLTGTIEGVEGNVITVNTDQGPLRAVIGDETVIQRLAVIGSGDLLDGLQVTVVGARNDAGEVEATSIFIVPEDGLAGLFGGGGGGFGGGRGFGGGGFGGGGFGGGTTGTES